MPKTYSEQLLISKNASLKNSQVKLSVTKKKSRKQSKNASLKNSHANLMESKDKPRRKSKIKNKSLKKSSKNKKFENSVNNSKFNSQTKVKVITSKIRRESKSAKKKNTLVKKEQKIKYGLDKYTDPNQNVVINKERIVEIDGKRIKETKIKTVERKQIEATNKLPVDDRKLLKKISTRLSQISKKDSHKSMSKNRKSFAEFLSMKDKDNFSHVTDNKSINDINSELNIKESYSYNQQITRTKSHTPTIQRNYSDNNINFMKSEMTPKFQNNFTISETHQDHLKRNQSSHVINSYKANQPLVSNPVKNEFMNNQQINQNIKNDDFKIIKSNITTINENFPEDHENVKNGFDIFRRNTPPHLEVQNSNSNSRKYEHDENAFKLLKSHLKNQYRVFVRDKINYDESVNDSIAPHMNRNWSVNSLKHEEQQAYYNHIKPIKHQYYGSEFKQMKRIPSKRIPPKLSINKTNSLKPFQIKNSFQPNFNHPPKIPRHYSIRSDNFHKRSLSYNKRTQSSSNFFNITPTNNQPNNRWDSNANSQFRPSIHTSNLSRDRQYKNTMESNSNNKMNETFIPQDLSDKILYLSKKILVYTSKIEFLQKKIYSQNENFDVNQIFKEIDQYSKGYLTLDDMSFFCHSFGFDLNDWDVFKIMSFASKYRLASLQELDIRERIDNDRVKNMDKKWFGGDEHDQGQNNLEVDDGKPIYYLDQNDFSTLIKPFDFGFLCRQGVSDKKHQMRKKDFDMIKQIILLTLRKLEDMSRAVKMLREHSSTEIYEFICQFNPSNYSKQEKLDGSILNNNILSSYNLGINIYKSNCTGQPRYSNKQAKVQIDDSFPCKLTFENFLNFHNIRFVKKDTNFILNDMGSRNGILEPNKFIKFLNSDIWDN